MSEEGAAPPHVDKPPASRPPWFPAVAAILLFLLVAPEASLLVTGGVAMFIVSGQGLLLAAALLRRTTAEGAVRLRLLKSAIYGAAACHAYEKDQGRLPEDLSVLVPNDLPSLPERLCIMYCHQPPANEYPAYFFYPYNLLGIVANYQDHAVEMARRFGPRSTASSGKTHVSGKGELGPAFICHQVGIRSLHLQDMIAQGEAHAYTTSSV